MRQTARNMAVRPALLVFLLLLVATARAADPAALVKQLGDDAYAVRQEAVKQLLACGPSAEAALHAGLKDGDAEVRRRCRWLIEEIAANDFRKRREAFLADQTPGDGHGLPCWARYHEIAGKEPHARRLFGEMLRDEPALLQAAAGGAAAASAALTERLQSYSQYGGYDPFDDSGGVMQYSQGSLAAFWLLMSEPAADGASEEWTPAYLAAGLAEQPEFQSLVRDAELGLPMKRLVGRWLISPGPQEQRYERLPIAVRYQLVEGVALAIDILCDKNQVANRYRAQAIMAIGALGGKEHARLLADVLEDKNAAEQYRSRRKYSPQVRDVALVWLIHLTGQNHAEYGLPKAKAAVQQVLKGNDVDLNEGAFSFSENKKREEAIERWKKYVAEHPLPELPAEIAEKIRDATAPSAANTPRRNTSATRPTEAPQLPLPPAPKAGDQTEPARRIEAELFAPVLPAPKAGDQTPTDLPATALPAAPAAPPEPGAAEPGTAAVEPQAAPPPSGEPAEAAQKSGVAGAVLRAVRAAAVPPADDDPFGEAEEDMAAETDLADPFAIPPVPLPAPRAMAVPALLPDEESDDEESIVEDKPLPEHADPFALPVLEAVEEATEAEDVVKRPPPAMRWPLADRELVRNLGIARQLARDRHYAQAARLVDEALAAGARSIFVPDRKTPLVRSLHAEGERLLAEWPAAGRRAYVARYGAEAAEMLAQAARSGDRRLLAAVAERWFFTPAGAEAALLVAIGDMDRGDVFHAVHRLQRIRRHAPDADRLEPALSLRLAVGWLQLGERREAEAVLRALKQKHPQFETALAGLAPAAALSLDALCKRLEAQLPPSAAAGEPPPIYSPELAKTAAADVGLPLLAPEALPLPPIDPRVARIVQRHRSEDEQKYRAAAPGTLPLVVGHTAVFRTPTHLAAVDLYRGQALWETPLEDSLQHYLRLRPPPPEEKPKGSRLGARLMGLFTGQPVVERRSNDRAFARGLRHRLWHDRSFGTLTSDGRRVFGVEHLHLDLPDDYQRLVVEADGTFRFDANRPRPYNLLTAYDLATGKLLWEIGGPKWQDASVGEGTPEPGVDNRARFVPQVPGMGEPVVPRLTCFSTAEFLGPPLPVADRGFVLADANHATYLLELQIETGKLLGALMLSARTPVRSYDMHGMEVIDDGMSSAGGGSCTLADGVLVCHAGNGQFFGVEMATRSFLWAYPLTELEPEPDDEDDAFIEPEFFNPMENLPENRWADCGALVAGDRVLLTSPKLQTLDCLRLCDGKLLWSAPRRDGLYLGGVQGGCVMVVDRGGLRCLRLADGKSAWPIERLALPDGAVPSGRGYMSQQAFFLPLRPSAVLAVDWSTGRIVARHRGREATPAGNLLAFGSGALLQTVDGLFRCAPLAESGPTLAAALAERPDDPDLLARQSEVLMARGQWADALTRLRRAHQLQPTAAMRRQLADLAIDALRADFVAYSPLAVEIERVLDEPARAPLLRELATGAQAAGQRRAAFDRYLKLIDAARLEKLERLEVVREVRLDRWLAARLAEVYREASAEERPEFDRQVAARLRDEAPQDTVALFGWHPASARARLKLAALAETARQPHQVEWHLQCVVQTGGDAQRREAAERLAALARKAHRPAARWPAGKVAVEADSKALEGTQTVPVPVTSETGARDAPLTLLYDMSNDRLIGCDGDGRRRWQVSLPPAADGGYFGGYEGWRAWRRGRLVVVQIGQRFCAVDALHEQGSLLWSRQPEMTDAMAIEAMAMLSGEMAAAPDLPGGETLRVALSREAVCFQIGARLYGVDPLTGATLWMRDDLPSACDLVGDDEALLVTPTDGADAVVLSPVDGRDLGACRVPPREERLWTLGRRVATWKIADGRARLALFDPWREKTLWQRDFAPGAKTHLVDGDAAAVLEPAGRLAIVGLSDGRDTAAMQADATPDLKGIAVIRGSSQWLLLTNTSIHADPMMGAWGFGWGWAETSFTRRFSITGCVYAFDRDGKRLWTAKVANQSLPLHQPADLPVLAFVANSDRTVWGTTRQQCRMLCLDRRTGAELHQMKVGEYRDTSLDIHSDPAKARVELRSMLGRLTLTFTDESPAPK